MMRWTKKKCCKIFKLNNFLPLSPGKSGELNCELSDAKCGGKNNGGVALGVPLSRTGRNPPLL